MRRPALAAGFRTEIGSPGWSSSRALSGRSLTRHNFDQGQQKPAKKEIEALNTGTTNRIAEAHVEQRKLF